MHQERFLRPILKLSACKSIVSLVSRERVFNHVIEQPARGLVDVMYVRSSFLKPRHHYHEKQQQQQQQQQIYIYIYIYIYIQKTNKHILCIKKFRTRLKR